MKDLRQFLFESTNNELDKDTIKELDELNVHSPEELKNVFKVLNYKKESKEAQDIIDNLPKFIIDILKKYGYAHTKEYYYNGIRALFSRIHIENEVINKLNASKEINNVKQVSHDIDRKQKYDFTSSIGNIDVKIHLYGNRNFSISKNDFSKNVDWYCFVDMDLSDVNDFKNKFKNATLYLVNVKDYMDKENIKGFDQPESYKLIKINDVKQMAKYII